MFSDLILSLLCFRHTIPLFLLLIFGGGVGVCGGSVGFSRMVSICPVDFLCLDCVFVVSICGLFFGPVLRTGF